MLTPTSKKIINKILHICQNTGIQRIRNNSNLSHPSTMADPAWKKERTRNINLSLEERRKLYSTKDFVTVNMIDPWDSYVVRHKGLESRKTTEDDLTEFKKLKINNSLNKTLAQKVSIYRGDITKLELGAIVNAANSMLKAGGGVDGAIHRAAGPFLQEECNSLNGCPTGQAKITAGYHLPAKFVIHTVGPQDGSPKKLAECYENSLSYCRQYKLKSIAFPCISTGIYGFPNRLAAHIALRICRKFLEENHEEMERIIFCTFLPIDVDMYETLMQMYFPVHDWNYDDGPTNA
ncbi:unnamed protein product [Chrysodeixis includens]|uniref:Macro domain-containing protein n=1 Tax=Chrysodeixis includens TaxID=689277 RepID=A0A9P0BXC0_CHRIL|nr:unnamed protein product [Chrysodeixis includens]